MSSNLVQFVECRNDDNTASVKAPADISKIAFDLGFKRLGIRSYVPSKNTLIHKILCKICWFVETIRLQRILDRNTIVLLQETPAFLCRSSGREFLLRQKKRGVHFIYLIHDIAELREESSSVGLSRIFLNVTLNVCDRIIVHNDKMKSWLIDYGIDENKIIVLGAFDYLQDNVITKENSGDFSSPYSIVIAGNLGIKKAPYIYKLSGTQDISWKLYGPYFKKELMPKGSSFEYCGSFAPDELPLKLAGHFGLVWDGDSLATCSGVTGQYLRYNNPHKLSLYLSCGIPVIIWADAAEATFVLNNNVGLCVKSIADIPVAINALGDDGYVKMCEACRKLAKDLCRGEFTKNALTAAISDL